MCPLEVREHVGNRCNCASERFPYLLLMVVPLGGCDHYIDRVHIGAFGSWQDAMNNIEQMRTCLFFKGLHEQAQVHYMAACASPLSVEQAVERRLLLVQVRSKLVPALRTKLGWTGTRLQAKFGNKAPFYLSFYLSVVSCLAIFHTVPYAPKTLTTPRLHFPNGPYT